jgi:Zn-finger nucleic acid-binding protein
MAKCKHCSAPLPRKSIICEYCGVRNDIELHNKNIGIKLPKSKRTCPDCLIYLDSIDIGKNSRFIIEKCSRCYGLFFDNHELERLIEQSVGKSYWIDYHKLHSLLQYPLHKDKVIYRRCPVCNKMMHRKNYSKRSGVIMDFCADHGVWLDAGELKQIQEWTKLGGKQNAIKEELDKKHRQHRAREQKRASLNRSRHYESFSLDQPMRFDDLFETLSSMFSFK